MESSDTSKQGDQRAPRRHKKLRAGIFWLLRSVIGIVILGGSLYLGYHWISNPPRTQRRPAAPESTLVEVIEVRASREPVIVEAMGTVIPARETRLAAQVAGKIVRVSPNFIPGGLFSAGETIVEIEPEDYRIALKQQEANLAKAESSLKLEMGQQAVARQEYQLIGKTATPEDEELLLRKPQLVSAKATVEGAMAALDKARLDLARTVLTVPYNCVIQTRSADLGGYVSPGTPLATIVGTDVFWVEVSVAVDDLKWLDIPQQKDQRGSLARIFSPATWGDENFREGEVIRLLPDLDEGRMARLLVAINDPLCLSESYAAKQALILKSFVRVNLWGKELSDVVKLPRKSLREGDVVWVMNDEKKLEFRTVSVIWSNSEFVYVSQGLRDNEKVVTSNLTVAVPGMALRIKDSQGDSRQSQEDNVQEGR